MGQFHVLHVPHEVALDGVTTQARVESFFFCHRGDAAAGVVVTWVEQARFGQGKNLFGDRAPQDVGIALLEITAPATAHQEGIAGEGHRLVVEHEADAAIGVAGGAAHGQLAAPKADLVTMGQGLGDVLGAGRGGQANGTAGGLLHQPAACYMVGMGVGVDRGHQFNAQLSD